MASTNDDMAETSVDQPGEPCSVTVESVKMAADANSITLLDDGATRELADQATFRIRTLLQTAQKYAMHAKRQKLTADDLDLALKAQGQEPLYGIHASEHIPFRQASVRCPFTMTL